MKTVTVTKKGKRFVSAYSALPGREFGPFDFAEMIRDLRVAALLTPQTAFDLVCDASVNGSATAESER